MAGVCSSVYQSSMLSLLIPKGYCSKGAADALHNMLGGGQLHIHQGDSPGLKGVFEHLPDSGFGLFLGTLAGIFHDHAKGVLAEAYADTSCDPFALFFTDYIAIGCRNQGTWGQDQVRCIF